MENKYIKLIIDYLEGHSNKDEINEFYEWVNKSDSNKEFFFDIKMLYDANKSLKNVDNIDGSWERLFKKKTGKKPYYFNFWYKWASYAAIVLFAVMFSTVFFLTILKDGEEKGLNTRYIGGDGLEADIVELPDGTRVSLGSTTTFHYAKDFGEKKRIVYLEGEAFFDVAKQKNKPFIVKTREQDIEALGTKFNVMAYSMDSLVITTLLEGSVRLTSAHLSEKITLHPNEQFTYNRNTKVSSLQKVDARQFVSWTSGYYYFPGQSLEVILDRLSHVYGVKFTVLSEDLYKKTFTGTFYRGQSIKDIMEIVNLSIPIKYIIDDRHVTILEI